LIKYNTTDTLPPKSPCWTRTDELLTLKHETTFEKFPRQRFRTKRDVKSFLATCAANAVTLGYLIVTISSSMDVEVFHWSHHKIDVCEEKWI
jgi:hypothetical protein